jgi:uncharacterized protein (TIGR02594 family)
MSQDLKSVHYQNLRSQIKNGDVLLFTKKNTIISWLISHGTGSRHVHVALAKWDGERLKTREFRELKGYDERYVSELGDFDHVATGFEWTKETDGFIQSIKDKSYSYLDAMCAGLGLPLIGDGYICSEFVPAVLNKQIKDMPSSPTPGDLSLWFWKNNYPMKKVSEAEFKPPGDNEHLKISELQTQLNEALPSGAFFMETDMSEPKHFQVAIGLKGIKEIVGKTHNPKVLQFYKTVGRPDIKNDETAWCAAFVGHCLVKGGYKHTPGLKALLARSYEEYGSTIYQKSQKNKYKEGAISDARPGDICVFPRGNSTWQGHVAFFVKETPKFVYVLGGNQNNEVNIRRYSKNKLLTIRRANESCLLEPRPAMPKVENLPAGNDNVEVKQPLNIDISKSERVTLGRKVEKKPWHKSRTLWATAVNAVGAVMLFFQQLINALMNMIDVISAPVFKVKELIPSFNPSVETLGLILTIGALGTVIYAYADDRKKLDESAPNESDEEETVHA